MTDKDIANQISNSLLILERKAVREARGVTTKLRKLSRRAFTTRNPNIVGSALIQDLQPTLRDMMIATHLNGIRRSQLLRAKSKKKSPLSLGIFDQVIKQLGNVTGSNLIKLRKQFGNQAFDLLKDVSDSVNNELRAEISLLIQQGATVKTGIKALNSKFDRLGLTTTSSHQLETMFRTQSQLAHNAGRWAADQDPDIDEILWGYKYVTVGDDRVRPEHAAMDGVMLPKAHPFWKTWWPPNGFNCRCAVISIFEERKVIAPPKTLNGQGLTPDKGFQFNPGIALTTAT